MEQPNNHEHLTVQWAQSQPLIAAFIASLVPDFHDADDILQNVAVVTVRKYEQFDPQRSFVAWAIGIAKNEILKYQSKQGKRGLLDIDAIDSITQVYTEESSTIYDTRIDLKNAISTCMSRLKGKWKQIMEMHYLREQSAARIAQQLGITRNSVFVSLHRIRIALRDCVNRRLGEGNV
ncbi:sigma-70 family RNA polymerase sigma factor [Planctomycetota bacterium]